MKMYLLSDNIESLLGMRFAGVDGVVLDSKDEVIKKINELSDDKDCGVILITTKLKKLCDKFLGEFMKNNPMPLILEIPDRHSVNDKKNSILDFIENSIGVKLNSNG